MDHQPRSAMRTLQLRTSALTAILALTACLPPSPLASPRGRNFMRLEDVPPQYQAWTVLDMLREVRPDYLRNRANSPRRTAPREPVVYVNGIRLAEVEMLRHYATRTLLDVRYVRGVDAIARYGLDHEGGVLFVRVGGP